MNHSFDHILAVLHDYGYEQVCYDNYQIGQNWHQDGNDGFKDGHNAFKDGYYCAHDDSKIGKDIKMITLVISVFHIKMYDI